MRKIALALTALFLTAPTATAKDLDGRLGIGFNNQFSGLSSLSARYNLPFDGVAGLAIEGNLGVSMMSGSDDALFVGFRGLYTVVTEDNMNLWVGGGVGYLSEATQGALRVQPVVGAEFFLYGLENLGFTMEWGLNVDLSSNSRVHTISGAPMAGVHYYF